MTEGKKHSAVSKETACALFSALAFLSAGAALLLFPGAVKESVGGSILYCLTALVPSLFPFMALTCYAVESGAGETLGRVLGGVTRHVFRLPEACAVPILMSFLGGYPAGAKGASLLLKQGKITREQAGRMMLFCVGPGAAFVVTYLGGGVLHSFRAGWILFASVTLSGLLLGVLTGLGSPVPQKEKAGDFAPTSGALMRAVSGSSRSVLTMCACIVLFAGFTAVLRGSGLFALLCRGLERHSPFSLGESAALFSFLLEVTGGVGDAAAFRVGPSFYAFGLAFGGLCVHLQIFSLFQAFPGKKWKFFLFRFLHGLLAAGAALLLTHWLPGEPVETFSAGTAAGASPLSGTLAGGLSLLTMCVAFLLIAGQEEEKRLPGR